MPLNAARIPEAVWGVPFAQFVGPNQIGPQYAFDGRHEDNAVHLDADIGQEVLWKSDDGAYSVHPVADADWEPESTVLLVHEENVVGFYAQGMVWIDKEHRGRGMAPFMILSGCIAHGAVPYNNTRDLGFSEAGFAAHEAAWREGVKLAFEAGLPVPDHVVGEAIVMAAKDSRSPMP